MDDATGLVEVAWTDPQVAWPMARGGEGAFGGKRLNSLPVWLGFCAVFVLGLGRPPPPALDTQPRPARARLALGLAVVLQRGPDLHERAARLSVLLYLLGRMLWMGARDRAPAAARPVWPVWLLAAAMFLCGFRIGLDVANSNVIDVGYSGVIGAHRIASGQAPYGHFPNETG